MSEQTEAVAVRASAMLRELTDVLPQDAWLSTLTLDAKDGIRADATGRVDDVVVNDMGGETLARVPTLTAQLNGFGLGNEALQVQRLVTGGTITVRDPTAKRAAAFKSSTVRASVTDLTWPATTPGLVDVHASIPGGGTLAVTGTVRPPPAATQAALLDGVGQGGVGDEPGPDRGAADACA